VGRLTVELEELVEYVGSNSCIHCNREKDHTEEYVVVTFSSLVVALPTHEL